MTFKKAAALAITTLALNLGIFADANAASADVKCEFRSSRSKISADGRGLAAGYYRAYVKSGTNAKWAKAFKRPVGGEVEFDFDSNPADVTAGATPISSAFITASHKTVLGYIYSYNTSTKAYRLIAMGSKICTAK